MTIYLIQHATGKCLSQLSVLRKFTEYMCELFGYVYIVTTHKICFRNPMHDKVARINEVLRDTEDGDIVIWLDTDAAWYTPEPLHAALPAGCDIAFAAIELVSNYFYNTGVIVIRAGTETRSLFARAVQIVNHDEEFVSKYNVKELSLRYGVGEQWFLNHLLLTDFKHLRVHAMDARYNYYREEQKPTEPTVVRAFHGRTPRMVSAGLLHCVKVLTMRFTSLRSAAEFNKRYGGQHGNAGSCEGCGKRNTTTG